MVQCSKTTQNKPGEGLIELLNLVWIFYLLGPFGNFKLLSKKQKNICVPKQSSMEIKILCSSTCILTLRIKYHCYCTGKAFNV